MDSTILAALISIAGALGGTYLGMRLNRSSAVKTALDLADVERHKYTQDRLWDHRKDSYTSIIAGLRATARLAKVVDDGYNDGEMHPEEYHGSEGSTKQINELWEKWRETKADYENARLLLSDAFVIRFEQLENDLDAVDHDDIPPAVYSACEKVFRDAVPALLEIAKGEIAPQLPTKP